MGNRWKQFLYVFVNKLGINLRKWQKSSNHINPPSFFDVFLSSGRRIRGGCQQLAEHRRDPKLVPCRGDWSISLGLLKVILFIFPLTINSILLYSCIHHHFGMVFISRWFKQIQVVVAVRKGWPYAKWCARQLPMKGKLLRSAQFQWWRPGYVQSDIILP